MWGPLHHSGGAALSADPDHGEGAWCEEPFHVVRYLCGVRFPQYPYHGLGFDVVEG